MSIIHSSSVNPARQPDVRPSVLQTKTAGIAAPLKEAGSKDQDPAFDLLVSQLLGVPATDARTTVSNEMNTANVQTEAGISGDSITSLMQQSQTGPSASSAETAKKTKALLGIALAPDAIADNNAVAQSYGLTTDKTDTIDTTSASAANPSPDSDMVPDKTAQKADLLSDMDQDKTAPQTGQPAIIAISRDSAGKKEQPVKNDTNASDMSVPAKQGEEPAAVAENAGKAGKQADDNGLFLSLLAPDEEGASGRPVSLESSPRKKAGDDVRPDSGLTSAAPGSIEFAALTSRDPAMARQTASAAGSAESNASLRVRATDPAEQFDRTVTIIRDGSRLAVKLEPDGLGKLDIDLRLNKGVVTAQIQVTDEAARKVIENNTQQIVDALIKEGLTIGGFSVSLRGGGAWNGPAENARQYEQARKEPALQNISAVERGPARGLVNIFV